MILPAQIACTLSAVALSVCALFCWACSAKAYTTAEFMPLLLYAGLVGVALLPLPVFHQPTRHFFATTCARVLLPLQVCCCAAGTQGAVQEGQGQGAMTVLHARQGAGAAASAGGARCVPCLLTYQGPPAPSPLPPIPLILALSLSFSP